MNPEGMVALLNYREDGITRKVTPFSYFQSNHCTSSLFYLLEGWPQGGKTLSENSSFFWCSRSISVVYQLEMNPMNALSHFYHLK